MTCHKCKQAHKGPRTAEQMHHEGCRELQRAAEKNTADATSYLRIQWVSGGLELAGWCTECIWAFVNSIEPKSQAVAQAEEALRACFPPIETPALGQSVHICKVIPLHPKPLPGAAVEKVARDLLDLIDINRTFDSEPR